MDIQPGTYRLATPAAKLHVAPDPSAELDTQVLFGETVRVLEHDHELWARVRADFDGKEGWTLFSEYIWAPIERTPAPTHRVSAVAAVVYREPHFKSAPVTSLSMNALVTAGDRMVSTGGEGEYVQILGLIGEPVAWIPADQLRPIEEFGRDYVEEALKFENTRYIWGFRDASIAVDCSAMVQHVLTACGIKSPRDSGPQSVSLGTEFNFGECRRTGYRRGDFIFFGSKEKVTHVAIMVDKENCIHGTIAKRKVLTQPLAEVIAQQMQDNTAAIVRTRRFEGYRMNLTSLVA